MRKFGPALYFSVASGLNQISMRKSLSSRFRFFWLSSAITAEIAGHSPKRCPCFSPAADTPQMPIVRRHNNRLITRLRIFVLLSWKQICSGPIMPDAS